MDQGVARPNTDSMTAYTAQHGAGKENKAGIWCKEACLACVF